MATAYIGHEFNVDIMKWKIYMEGAETFLRQTVLTQIKKKGYSSDVSRRSYIHALTTFCAPKKPTEQSWAEVKNYFQHITCRKLIQL